MITYQVVLFLFLFPFITRPSSDLSIRWLWDGTRDIRTHHLCLDGIGDLHVILLCQHHQSGKFGCVGEGSCSGFYIGLMEWEQGHVNYHLQD